jgi:transketolase
MNRAQAQPTASSLDQLCVNTIRTLAMDAVQNANSGHPGMPMGAAPMAYVLWTRHLRHNPKDPGWADRDRFVLSAGHGSMLLYALLHLTGYDVGMNDLKRFRQWGSRTPGHPERLLTPGVEATTGPLGQGTANAVGMAIAERALAHLFNRPDHAIVDHFTFALVSDGDLMEGVSAEASSLAGHLKLGKLIYLYDSNGVSLDGPLSMAFSTEDVAERYLAYGWQVLRVEDGDRDLAAIDRALSAAKAETARPSLIIVRTTIGYGSPHKAGTSAAHGSPLGAEEVKLAKAALGWDPEQTFYVPAAALEQFRAAVGRGEHAQSQWQRRLDAYATAFPPLAAQWRQATRGELPEGWGAALPAWKAGAMVSTRAAGGKALNAIAAKVPWLLGGDADLSSSTKTALEGAGAFDGQTGAGRNIHFGVREHAMGSIANGIAYHGGLRPFVSTFFVFSDYMRPPVRLAALSELPVICVWTHDSIAVGEDGPTHEPVEHLMALRAIPNMSIVRPADANETAAAWRCAMLHADGPVGLVLSRQDLPVLAATPDRVAEGVKRGAYVVSDPPAGQIDALAIATGSEVQLAVAAQQLLAAEGIGVRVVSMPCWEWFARQDGDYRDSVLPPQVAARVSVEAGVSFGWQRWIGPRGIAVGLDRFGASAPGEVNLEKLGFTAQRVAEAIKQVLQVV